MDIILFLKIVAWVLVIPSGLLSLLITCMWFYETFSEKGREEASRDRILYGQVLNVPRWIRSTVLFVVCVALLVSMR